MGTGAGGGAAVPDLFWDIHEKEMGTSQYTDK